MIQSVHDARTARIVANKVVVDLTEELENTSMHFGSASSAVRVELDLTRATVPLNLLARAEETSEVEYIHRGMHRYKQFVRRGR